MGEFTGLGEAIEEGGVSYSLFLSYTALLYEACCWVGAPIGIVEFAIAQAFIIDILIGSCLASDHQSLQFLRGCERE